MRKIYIARVFNDFEDAFRAYDRMEDAERQAQMYLAHLTAKERKKNWVSVEVYEVSDTYTGDAKKAYLDALDDGLDQSECEFIPLN